MPCGRSAQPGSSTGTQWREHTTDRGRPLAAAAALGMALTAFLAPSVLAQNKLPDLDYAKRIIAKHSQLPNFTPPGPPFDARKCIAGKKVLSIQVTRATPVTKTVVIAEPT